MRIAIVVGHNRKATGAYARSPLDVSEFDFNTKVALAMVRLIPSEIPGADLSIFYREPSSGGYSSEIRAVYEQVDRWNADCSVELHFNSVADRSATGTETLSSGSTKSILLSGAIQEVMLRDLKLRDRGVKVLKSGDNGYLALKVGAAPACITEPFFESNRVGNAVAAEKGVNGFAKMYLDGIKLYGMRAGFLNPKTPGAGIPIPVPGSPPPLESKPAAMRFSPPVSKAEFVRNNIKGITAQVDAVNEWLRSKRHLQTVTPLTLEDVVILFYAEAGLDRDGNVDIHHRHSLGETGMLPLPSNVSNWIGGDWETSTPEGNFSAFCHYLGSLKNSKVGREAVGGHSLYGGLFREDQSPIEQARILAASVHGYFYSGNFSDLKIPYLSLAKEAAAGDPVLLLNELGYKHTPNLIRNRLANLKLGEQILEGIRA